MERPVLLPTTALASHIHAVRERVRSLRQKNDTHRMKIQVENAKRAISRFIVRQIEAYPSISECELQDRLAAAFDIKKSVCESQEEVPISPRVFASLWSPKRTHRLFVIAYCLWLGFHGKGGSETVIESYVWEPEQGVRLAASIMPSSFSGYISNTQKVCWFPNPETHYPETYWVLVSGTVSGASGRALRGRAVVFEIGASGAKQLWSTAPEIGNVEAYAHAPKRWEVEYAEIKRFYANLPNARFLDIYEVDYSGRTYRRLIHKALD